MLRTSYYFAPFASVVAGPAVVMATLVLAVSPAAAAPGPGHPAGPAAIAVAVADVGIELRLPQVTMQVGEDREEIEIFARLHPSGGTAQVDGVTFSIDLSQATDVAVLDPFAVSYPPVQQDCSTVGPVVTCILRGPLIPADGSEFRLAGLWLSAKRGAAAGATGTMTVVARADDGPPTTRSSVIRIGEDVDLASTFPVILVPPGGQAGFRPVIRNVGTRTVTGVVFVMTVHPKLRAGEEFGNCTYGRRVVCAFDNVLQAGDRLTFAREFHFQVPADAARGSRGFAKVDWLTADEWADRLATEGKPDDGRPGTGAPVALVPDVAAARVPQIDGNPANNRGQLDLVVGDWDTEADVTVVGGTLRGAIGDEVSTSVGVVNHGPGTMYSELFYRVSTPLQVYLPTGFVAVRVDPRCKAEASGLAFICNGTPAIWRAGPPIMFDFTVRFGEDVTGEDGAISIQDAMLPVNEADGTWRNNKAKIVVTVLDPADGGTGGGLPITGADTGSLIAAGAALLLAGAGLLLVRRRVRFTA
jgi:LPXTG-motif cell wall-anchored protein